MRGPFGCRLDRLDQHDVGSLQPLGALLDGELHLLAFFQSAEAISLDCGEVHEHIVALWALNEAVAFAAVEPLYCTKNSIRHCLTCLLRAYLV